MIRDDTLKFQQSWILSEFKEINNGGKFEMTVDWWIELLIQSKKILGENPRNTEGLFCGFACSPQVWVDILQVF